MAFWIAALLAAALVTLYVVRPLALARASARPRAAHDAQVFRDQLAEVERDLERGVLDAEQARAARIEISRRLLAAAAEQERTADHAPAPRMASLALALVLLAGAPLGGLAIYRAIGTPGLPDMPASARAIGIRPGQAVAEAQLRREAPPVPPEAAEAVALVAQLEERLKGDNPDPQGLFLLARSYGQLQRFPEAWRTFRRLLDTRGGEAPAAIHVAMAEAMILSTAGYVSPEAEAALATALRREPANPVARYYMAAALAQTSQPAAALEMWAGLLRDSPADAPWVPSTEAQIADLVERTGLPRPAVAAAPAPSLADQRRQLLTMVDAMRDRLVADGGTVEEWVQLVRSYAALGLGPQAEAARQVALSALREDAEARAAFEATLAGAPMQETEPAPVRETIVALDARLRAEGGGAGAWLRLIAGWQALGEAQAAAEATAAARAALASDPGQREALEGGLRNATPAALRGPSAADVRAAAQMPAEDRTAMVRGMVEGLRDRLYSAGGTPEEWARLIQSFGVLGETAAATEAYARASAAHAADRTALAFLRETALLAGVTPP
jgi:cytochrome c-type biogenesis protein CcmH